MKQNKRNYFEKVNDPNLMNVNGSRKSFKMNLCLLFWTVLFNVITLGMTKSDNIIRMITKTDDFFLSNI